MKHPLLFELNTRCWLAELSRREGRRLTLADVPDEEFEFWQRSGFTHVWLMGVWALGRRGLAHSKRAFEGREEEISGCELAGSPFAIVGCDVSRKLGGAGALAAFRRKLNACGIKLVLDFIPNHTALDHPWVKGHPEFYVTSDSRSSGAVKPFRGAAKWFAFGHCGHGAPWVDTLQLDFRSADTRRAVIAELRNVAEQCDGVRCDMAMLALNEVFARTWNDFRTDHAAIETEFWTGAIAAVREHRPDFLFLAEVYWDLEARLQELGFDFTYDKRLYDHLIAHGAGEVTEYLHSLAPAFVARSAHFIENHDEPRVASLLPFAEHRAAALLVLALPGMRLLHEGQTTGRRIHTSVHLASRRDEVDDPPIKTFYEWALGALSRTAVGSGEGNLLRAQTAWDGNGTHRNIALVQWQGASRAFDLAVVNLSSVQSQCYAPLSIADLSRCNWRLTDFLGHEVHEREGAALNARGLYLDLAPHAAQLFHFEAIP